MLDSNCTQYYPLMTVKWQNVDYIGILLEGNKYRQHIKINTIILRGEQPESKQQKVVLNTVYESKPNVQEHKAKDPFRQNSYIS